MFFIRKEHPKIKIYEFIPGKLLDSNRTANILQTKKRLYKKYSEIDCFLLDENHSWEPILSQYLREHKNQYKIKEIPFSLPLENSYFYKKNSK